MVFFKALKMQKNQNFLKKKQYFFNVWIEKAQHTKSWTLYNYVFSESTSGT